MTERVRGPYLSAGAGPETPRARQRRATRSRSGSTARRRRSRRRRSAPTTWPSSGAAHGPSRFSRGLALLDDAQHAMRRLLDRELRDVDDRTAQASVQLLGHLELVVDLLQLRVLAVARTHRPHPGAADLGQAVRVDRETDDLALVDLEEARRRLDPLDDRDVRRLVAEVAEVDGERRLRSARDADEHDVRVLEPAPN